MKWLLVALYISKLADFSTTEMALSRGAVEENPYLKYRAVRIAILVFAPRAVYGIPGPKWVRVLGCATVTAIWSYMAYHNYRLYQDLGPVASATSPARAPPPGFRVQWTLSW